MNLTLPKKQTQRDMREFHKNEVWICDLGQGVGSEQKGYRPVLIIQGEIGNKFAPTVTIAPISSKVEKMKLQTQVYLDKEVCQLDEDSFVMMEQIRTVDKSRLTKKLADIPSLYLDIFRKAREVHLESIYL